MMATVFDRAVRELVREALAIERADQNFRSPSYEAFVKRLWTDQEGRSLHGLPPEVFTRAVKEAHERFNKITGGHDTPLAGAGK